MIKADNFILAGTGTLANTVAAQLLKSGRYEIVSCYTTSKRVEEK